MTRLFSILSAAIIAQCAMAQTIVTGRISNERGEAVEYATVALVGDTIGTLADAQGHFSLTIPHGKRNDLSITHVSYDKAIIPHSTYSVGKPLSIIVKDKNVKLDEVVVGKKNKLKTILGKKWPGPSGSFRGKWEENRLEWGPTFKVKKDWVVSDIFFTKKRAPTAAASSVSPSMRSGARNLSTFSTSPSIKQSQQPLKRQNSPSSPTKTSSSKPVNNIT